jgi:hypothetical protein
MIKRRRQQVFAFFSFFLRRACQVTFLPFFRFPSRVIPAHCGGAEDGNFRNWLGAHLDWAQTGGTKEEWRKSKRDKRRAACLVAYLIYRSAGNNPAN